MATVMVDLVPHGYCIMRIWTTCDVNWIGKAVKHLVKNNNKKGGVAIA